MRYERPPEAEWSTHRIDWVGNQLGSCFWPVGAGKGRPHVAASLLLQRASSLQGSLTWVLPCFPRPLGPHVCRALCPHRGEAQARRQRSLAGLPGEPSESQCSVSVGQTASSRANVRGSAGSLGDLQGQGRDSPGALISKR